jgi:hypothetical protein
MAAPSVTHTFSNSTTADATQVNTNFTDLIAGASDGTKDYSISALTCGGNVTFNGTTNTIGSASNDDLVINASLASTVPIKTTFSYDIGSATIGLRSIYLGDAGSAARSTRIIGATVASSFTLTLPTALPSSQTTPLLVSTSGVMSYGKSPTQQVFTSGSGTYTTASGALYIRVRMVGGGGGGGGSGTSAGVAAGNGGNTTFGSSLLTANGGALGQSTLYSTPAAGGAGGTATIASPGYGTALSGASGSSGAGNGASNAIVPGCVGASSPFGGGGAGGGYNAAGAGGNAVANTGAGGGSGGAGPSSSSNSGGSGGAGGFIDAIIPAPSASYGYAIAAAGTAGGAGGSGWAGGAGGSGYVEVTEYYQ